MNGDAGNDPRRGTPVSGMQVFEDIKQIGCRVRVAMRYGVLVELGGIAVQAVELGGLPRAAKSPGSAHLAAAQKLAGGIWPRRSPRPAWSRKSASLYSASRSGAADKSAELVSRRAGRGRMRVRVADALARHSRVGQGLLHPVLWAVDPIQSRLGSQKRPLSGRPMGAPGASPCGSIHRRVEQRPGAGAAHCGSGREAQAPR